MDRKKILLVTYKFPASNRRSWSGTSFSLKKELEKEYDTIDYCADPRRSPMALFKTFYYRKIKRSFVNIQMLRPMAKMASKAVNRIAAKEKCDCIVVLGAQASGAIAYNSSGIPIVWVSDCVISQNYDYYWFNVKKQVVKEFNDVQQRAIDNSTAIVMSSNWAKNGAIEDYSADPQKISVILFGGNIDKKDIKKEPHKGINLLFSGVDWERKGADTAVECAEILNKLDPDSHYTLHMVGCKPPRHIDSEHIKLYGFFDRNNKEGREFLQSLRETTDFFILPTRADCSPLVICEACAYGLPTITYDTGGIGDYVRNDINGYRLPVGSTARDFVKKIIEWAHDPEKVEEMRKNARRMYETELNWETTVKKLREVVGKVIQK